MRVVFLALLATLGCNDPADVPDLGARDVGRHDAGIDDMNIGDPDLDDQDAAPVDAGSDAGVPDGPITAIPPTGAVIGEVEHGIMSFLGIPYAEPPVGELRWAPPEPTTWTEPLEATSFGPRCPQPNIAFTSLIGEEDCLHLNVWAPVDDSESGRPVMVWFHGGSFVQGATVEKTYRAADLARHGVVVVTANYRLGALGYLSHRDLATRNVGLQDQLAALDWVQDNIVAFGGDRGRVTVFGESAGGISACLMVAAGLDDQRFNQALSQSGPCTGLLPLPDVDEANAQGDALAAAVGCEQADDVAACLRAAAVEDLVEALGFRIGVIFGDGAAWTPVRDDDLVPLDVEAALASPDDSVPMLLGSNADEGSLVLVGSDQGIVDVDYQVATQQMFPENVAMVRGRYPLDDYPEDADAIAAIVSDRFTCGTRRVARLRADNGHDVWLYHFTHPFITPIGDLGAMHGAELPFVFGTELALVKLRDDQQPLSELMQRYWTRFAFLGVPNEDPATDLEWPQYDADGDQHIVLDTEPSIGSDLRSPTCDFWDGIDGAR